MPTIAERLQALEPTERVMRDFIETRMIDEAGLVYSHLHTATLEPWRAEDLARKGCRLSFYNIDRGDPVGQLGYEDTIMATGEYALASLVRHDVSGAPDAIGAASLALFAILRVIYEGELYEKGFLPKPHGGMRRAGYSHEISVDQYIKAIVAMEAYRPFASPALARLMDEKLVEMADYHMNRNFIHPRRESFVVTPENRTHGIAFFIPICWLAYRITGEEKYRDALPRFDAVLNELLAGELPLICNIIGLFMEGFHLALQAGYDDERLARLLGRLWDERAALTRERGLRHNIPEQDFPSTRVTRISSFAPIVQRYFPEKQPLELGLEILEDIRDPATMVHVGDASKAHPLHRYNAETIHGVNIASWLVGYWRMRTEE